MAVATTIALGGPAGARSRGGRTGVGLDAAWRQASAEMEVAAVLAQFPGGPGLVLQFSEAWAAKAGGSAETEACVSSVLDAAAEVVPRDLDKLFSASLHARSGSSVVEYNKRAAESSSGSRLGASCWADVQGTPYEAVERARAAAERVVRADGAFPDVILYGPLGSPCLREFGAWLGPAAKRGSLRYTVRPVGDQGCSAPLLSCPASFSSSQVGVSTGDALVRLPGYGVSLVLKSTEYKAIDDSVDGSSQGADYAASPLNPDLRSVSGFNIAALVDRRPDLRDSLVAFQKELLRESLNSGRFERPLEAWQLQDLGIQIGTKVIASESPLVMLSYISQNFPTLEQVISQVELSAEALAEFSTQRKLLGREGRTLLWLNGAQLKSEDLHLHSMIDRVFKEVKFQRFVASLTNVPLAEISNLRASLAQRLFHSKQRIDTRDCPAIHYAADASSISHFNAKSKFNVGRSRKNIYSVVFIVDLSASDALVETATAMKNISDMRSNVRLGIVLLSEAHSDGEKFVQAFLLLMRAGGHQAAFEFFNSAAERLEFRSGEEFSWEAFESVFKDSHRMHTDPRRRPRGMGDAKWAADSMRGANDWVQAELKEEVALGPAFARERGLRHGDLVVNGIVRKSNLKNHLGWEAARSIDALVEDYAVLREGLANGEFQDNEQSALDFIFRNSSPKYAPFLAPSGGAPGGISASSQPGDGVWESVQRIGYSYKPESSVPDVTTWVFFNENSEEGLALLNATIVKVEQQQSNRSRTALLPIAEAESALSLLLLVLPSMRLTNESRCRFLAELFRRPEVLSALKGHAPHAVNPDQASELAKMMEDFGIAEEWKSALAETNPHGASARTFRNFLSLKSPRLTGSNVVISNGWAVVSPPDVAADDIAALEAFVMECLESTRISRLAELAPPFPNTGEGLFPADRALLLGASIVESIWDTAPRDEEWKNVQSVLAKCRHTCRKGPSREGKYQVIAVVNPIGGPETPRISAMLEVLGNSMDIDVTLLMNPPARVKEPPLRFFYRYVLPTPALAVPAGLHAPEANFDDLQGPHMLSLHMDVPETWEVLATEATMDLYNMKISEMKNVRAKFQLQYFVLAGNIWLTRDDKEHRLPALEEPGHDHPAGVRVQVRRRSVIGDSTVQTLLTMGNHGYFQVKALPGLYTLSLEPGCSQSVYALNSPHLVASGWGGSSTPDALLFEVSGFGSVDLQITGALNSRFTNVSQCEEAAEASSAGSLGGWVRRNLNGLLRTPGRGTVHIYSLASGHMYERLLRIMILSLTKTTRRRVKFWFLKSYASPAFIELLGAMASHYDFDFEFVSYKWPKWLFQQGDQQRLMWAYKILFLDVLFPPEVDRITFIDADQVLRADVGELHDMDLQGAPYAYTPFCNDYAPMEGYRFWKADGGFWAKHLEGRAYHISALYVVDLKRFRRMAAGDKLRNLYNKLAADGKSLSNLDQDLPNYAQYLVPIFSLPQDWLYCETWCGPDALATAKAIDLCNNPATRESKFDGARRIIEEWTTLDAEQRAFSEAQGQGQARAQTSEEEL